MGTQEQGYNGWATRDTWAVALNLMNDEAAYEETERWCEEADFDRRALEVIASERYLPFMVDEVDPRKVSWREIAEAMLEAWTQE